MTLLILSVLVCLLDIAASLHVVSDHRRLGYEKAAEVGLIWIVPLVGVLVSLCITLQGPARIREYEDTRRFFTTSP